jgi:hypothetical protein
MKMLHMLRLCFAMLLFATLLALGGSAPTQAKFLTPDTYDPWKDGVDVNRYAYGANDPINKSDPNGHCTGGGRDDADCDGVDDFRDLHPGADDNAILSINPMLDSFERGRQGGGMSRESAGDMGRKIDQAKLRNYLGEIERLTGNRIASSQRNLLSNDLRTNSTPVGGVAGPQLASVRRQYNNMRDRLIDEWERNTGKKWPRYSSQDVREGIGNRVGSPYEPHHIRQLADGGGNTWWNITPASQRAHRGTEGIHRSGGALQSLRSFFRSLFGG